MNVANQAERITAAIDSWLKAEVVTSGEGRNKYLDSISDKELVAIQSRMLLPFDDDANWNARKHDGHANRVPQNFFPEYETAVSPGEVEYTTAQLLFAPLMSLSGAYRMQCYLENKTAKGYLEQRQTGIGIDLEQVIARRLVEIVPDGDLSAAEITLGGLKRSFDYAYVLAELHIRGMIARSRYFEEVGQAGSLSVSGMKKSQMSFGELATDCIAFAAKMRRGELEAVPFLEPVSITDQSTKVYYPLSKPVNWLIALNHPF